MEFCFWLASAHLLSSILTLYETDTQHVEITEFGDVFALLFNYFFGNLKLSPAQIILLSFIGVIFVGTFLLMVPISSVNEKLEFWDALFIATSATCVTGFRQFQSGKTSPFLDNLLFWF